MWNKKLIFKTLLAALILIAVSREAFAYGEQIGSALDRTVDWITRILGGAITVMGIAWTGIRLALHDEDALRKGLWVVVGGIIIFMSKPILDLIKGLAGI